jgi:hypothetical protein
MTRPRTSPAGTGRRWNARKGRSESRRDFDLDQDPLELMHQARANDAGPERGVSYEEQLDEFVRDANLRLVRQRLAGEADPVLRQVLLDIIRALEDGEAIPAKALQATLAAG